MIDDCLSKNDEISQLIWGIVDVNDTWDQAIESINDVSNLKAAEIGIVVPSRKDSTKFREFQIQDMKAPI